MRTVKTIELKQPGIPLWRQISNVLDREITDGKLKPGAAIPSEHELMTRFDVSRHTARKAVARLREQGRINVSQGRGAFVREELLQYTVTERARFAKDIRQQGFIAHNRFIAAKKLPATAEIARLLKLPTRGQVWRLAALSYVDGVPVSLGRIFHPVSRFPDILEKREAEPDLAAVYAQYGIKDYTRLATWISTRVPTEAEATLLQIDVLDPVIVSQKVDVDSTGAPIEYNETLFSGRNVRLHFPATDLSETWGLVSQPPKISRTILD